MRTNVISLSSVQARSKNRLVRLSCYLSLDEVARISLRLACVGHAGNGST
jgi:hypothetical protein